MASNVVTSRVRLVQNFRPTKDGSKKRHVMLPFELVTVDGKEYVEPIDWVPVAYSGTTDKEVTGYQFLNGEQPFSMYSGNGGQMNGRVLED